MNTKNLRTSGKRKRFNPIEKEKKYSYYVIRLIDCPCPEFNEYHCVPDSWLNLDEIADHGVAIVRFPEEELPIKLIVKKKKKIPSFLNIFVAEILRGSDSYEQGCSFIKKLEELDQQEPNNEIVEKDSIPSENTLTTSSNIIKMTEMKAESKHTVLTHKQIESEETNSANSKMVISRAQPALVENIECSDTHKRYMTRQSVRTLDEQSNISLTSITQEKAEELQTSFETSDEEDQNYEEDETTSHESEPIQDGFPYNFANMRPLFGENCIPILETMYKESENHQHMFDIMRCYFKQQCIIIKKIIDVAEKFNNYDTQNSKTEEEQPNNDVVETTNKASAVTRGGETEEQTLNEENVKQDKHQDDQGSEDKTERDDDDNYVPKKIRGKARKFTFPVEYDQDDSKWTLKYKKKRPGLVELMPHSGVYVKALNLANYKATSKDSKTLARNLLLEIFSENALKTCSLTGKRANAFYTDYNDVRPGLDKKALSVLQNYVEKQALKRKRSKNCYDSQAVTNALRNKLQDMRQKNG